MLLLTGMFESATPSPFLSLRGAQPQVTSPATAATRTRAVHSLEAFPLYRGVRVKPEKQAAARSHHGIRRLAATEAAEDGGQAVCPVVQF